MNTMLQYKCPSCGGQIEFDSKTQQMKCPYCDSEFEIETLKQYDEALKNEPQPKDDQWDMSGTQWGADETNGMGVFVCESCGGEVVAEETTAATSCPYCGNPVVLMGRLAGDLRPDLVIPFKLDKKAAKEALKKHLKGKLLLPDSFREENHIDEIKGVYVPFWLFDADVDANIRYRGTKVRTWTDTNYLYTETRHFSIVRAGDISFDAVPADGSSKMADDLMESIEPYDLSQAVDFQTAYLSGFLADRYDVTAEQSVERVNERIRKSTEEQFASTVSGYSSLKTETSNINVRNGKAKYALYPVWLLNTTWKGENFYFAMNGQTGKFVGNLPMDKAKYWKWFGIWSAILSGGTLALIIVLKIAGVL